MTENKWIGLSRSLWSAMLPVLALILNQAGVTGADQIGELASNVFNGTMLVVAAVLQYLHQRNPKPTTLAK